MDGPAQYRKGEAAHLMQENSSPRVVVGIVTRDRASVVRRAVDSALGQSRPGLTVWVLNDGSIDETKRVLAEYPGIGVIDYSKPQGCIAARSTLMSHVDADYFVSLDDDAWFVRGDEIDTATKYLESHSDMAAIAFDILSPDKPNQRAREEARNVSMFIGCGHVLRMAAVRAAGGYASAPGTYGSEEKDLALRLLNVGYRIVLLPGVHVWHDKTGVAREQPAQHRSGVCNDLAMTLRRTPLVVLPFAMVAKLYRHFRFSRANGLEAPFWEGLQLFWESLPELWRTRRPVRLSALRTFLKLTKTQAASSSL
jgi:glycosyltransferase involved in cell wall biosynthesis